MFRNLILQNRSYRRFDQNQAVSEETLLELVDYARLSPIAVNRQCLKFYMANQAEENRRIFPTLSWAGSLKDWDGPQEGERPAAYILILLDTKIADNAGANHGIAAQSILLGAVEKGLGGCMLGAVNRKQLKADLSIPEQYEVLLVIALGKPAEKVVLEDAPSDDTTYYRDEEDVHHVPKYPLSRITLSKADFGG